MKPALAPVGSAVAVLSQSSSIELPFFATRRGHVVYNNCALYILLYKQQCRGFCYCTKSSIKGARTSGGARAAPVARNISQKLN